MKHQTKTTSESNSFLNDQLDFVLHGEFRQSLVGFDNGVETTKGRAEQMVALVAAGDTAVIGDWNFRIGNRAALPIAS
jgi:hypothetical protein